MCRDYGKKMICMAIPFLIGAVIDIQFVWKITKSKPPILILRKEIFCFFRSVATASRHLVHKSERGMRAFIYALSH